MPMQIVAHRLVIHDHRLVVYAVAPPPTERRAWLPAPGWYSRPCLKAGVVRAGLARPAAPPWCAGARLPFRARVRASLRRKTKQARAALYFW